MLPKHRSFVLGPMCLTRDILLEMRECTGQATFVEVTQYKGGGDR